MDYLIRELVNLLQSPNYLERISSLSQYCCVLFSIAGSDLKKPFTSVKLQS
jgi:hypothetical protein